MTSRQAAEYLGVSLNSIRRWSDAGLLPHWRTPSGHRRFDAQALDDWLDGRMLGLELPQQQSPGGCAKTGG